MSEISVGKIVNVRGLHGEIKVLPHTNVENMFEKLKSIKILGNDYKIKSVKHIKNCVALLLDTVDTVEKATDLVGNELFVKEENMPKLEKDNYYLKDLIGVDVTDINEGELGKLTNVYFTGANDVYEITAKDGKTSLIPAVKEFVKEIDIDKKIMTVELIEGMFPA